MQTDVQISGCTVSSVSFIERMFRHVVNNVGTAQTQLGAHVKGSFILGHL